MNALRCFFQMLIQLVTSKKFVTGAITAVTTVVISDPTLATKIAAIGTAVVLGFAAQDVGKEKAKIAASLDPKEPKYGEMPEITP